MKDIQSFLFDVKNNSSFARYLDIFEFTEDEKMLASALLDEIDYYRRLSKKYRRRYFRQMRLKRSVRQARREAERLLTQM